MRSSGGETISSRIDRFEIISQAGEGGMGVVYRGRDTQSGALVAIKVLHSDTERDRFERETVVLAALQHPSVVRYVAHGALPSGLPYLVMEWLEGLDLEAQLARGKLPPGVAVEIVRRAAEGLGAAHALGIVHRDVKPSNVFLVSGRADDVRVLDFGIARATAGRLTRTGVILGTPHYMAPEQARGARDVTAAADVFSLGCVMFECLTGETAFSGDSLSAVLTKILFEEPPRVTDVVPHVPAEIASLVAAMLAKDPAQRPKDAAAVARALAGQALPAQISQHPGAITEGEQRIVSVVSLRSNDPDDLWARVQRTQEGVERLFTQSRAMVRPERLADGSIVMVLSGSGTDSAARAAELALFLRERIPDATGSLATGTAKTGARTLGEVIDRAMRLLARTHAGILVDDATAEMIADRFSVEQGRLIGRAQIGPVRTLLGKPTPCVGRDPELAALEATLLHAASEGEAKLAAISGQPGIGKSRVRYELVKRVAPKVEELETWLARGDPVGVGSSFGLLAELLRRTCDIAEREPVEARRAKLRARVARSLGEEAGERAARFLGQAVGAAWDDEGDVQLLAARAEPMVMGDRIRTAWLDFIGAELAVGPRLIVLEDLQWGDRASVALIAEALRQHRDRPLMVLAVGRPEMIELLPELFVMDPLHVQLAPLSKKACERLVAATLGGADEALAKRIVEQCTGNPLFLEELVRWAAEAKQGSALPPTVMAMVQARLDALEPDARRALRAASVFGSVFWEGGVRHLVGPAHAKAASRWIDELVRREFFSQRPTSEFEGERELFFRHDVVREAAYAMLPDSDRTLGHRLAAEWLQRVGAKSPRQIAEHLAIGDPGAAIAAITSAAAQALEGNDFAQTIELATRGLSLSGSASERAMLLRLRADARAWLGEYSAAEADAADCMTHAPEGSDVWTEAVVLRARSTLPLGLRETIVALAEKIQPLASVSPTDRVLVAAARVTGALVLMGLFEHATALVETIDGASASPRAPLVTARIEHARSLYAIHKQRIAEYYARSRAAADAFAHAGDARNDCMLRINSGYALVMLGDYERAEHVLRQVLERATKLGIPSILAFAKNNLGWAVERLGRHDEAIHIEREAITHFAKSGDRRLEGGSRKYIAHALFSKGSLEEAEREAHLSIALLETTPPLLAHALGLLARVRLARGDAAGALEIADQAAALLESLGSLEEGEAVIHLAQVLACKALGDEARAAAIGARAKERVLTRAAAVDPEYRECFLAIEEHAAILNL